MMNRNLGRNRRRPARAIEAARRRTLAWLDCHAGAGRAARRAARSAPRTTSARWPGVLLPGTYNGRHGAAPDRRSATVSQRSERARPRRLAGSHRLRRRPSSASPAWRDDDVFKKPDPAETWGYIDFHVTNYSLGAIEALDPATPPGARFRRGPSSIPLRWRLAGASATCATPGRKATTSSTSAASCCCWRAARRRGDAADRGACACDPVRLARPAAGARHRLLGRRPVVRPVARCCTPWRARCTTSTSGTRRGRPLPLPGRAVDYVPVAAARGRQRLHRRRRSSTCSSHGVACSSTTGAPTSRAGCATLLPPLLATPERGRRLLRRARRHPPPGRLGARLRGAAGAVQHLRDLVPLDRHRDDRRPALAGPLALAFPPHGRHRLPQAERAMRYRDLQSSGFFMRGPRWDYRDEGPAVLGDAVDGVEQFVHGGDQGELGQLAAGAQAARSRRAAMGCDGRRSSVGIHRAARSRALPMGVRGQRGLVARLPDCLRPGTTPT